MSTYKFWNKLSNWVKSCKSRSRCNPRKRWWRGYDKYNILIKYFIYIRFALILLLQLKLRTNQLLRFLQIPYLILQLNTFICKHCPSFIIWVHLRWTMWHVLARIQNGGPSSKNADHPTTKSRLFSLWVVNQSGDLNRTFLWVRP